MSNELLNAYIKFGEPDGDDLDFSQIADWAGYLLQEQRERIAELERAYDILAEEKLDKLVSYKKRIAGLEAQLAEKNEYIIQLECAVNNLQQNTITAMSERDTLADDCSKLEAQLAKLETENQRLRDKVADWQNRFTEGLQYDSENNQTVLVWTQREIDQAKSEADELCRKLGIPLEKEG